MTHPPPNDHSPLADQVARAAEAVDAAEATGAAPTSGHKPFPRVPTLLLLTVVLSMTTVFAARPTVVPLDTDEIRRGLESQAEQIRLHAARIGQLPESLPLAIRLDPSYTYVPLAYADFMVQTQVRDSIYTTWWVHADRSLVWLPAAAAPAAGGAQ